MRCRSLALALVTPLALLAAAGAPAQQERFSGQASVVVVEIPVQVVKDGEPVRGLTAANFEVWDGKTRRRITGFEVVDFGRPAGETAGAPAPVPAAARRNFLLLFDLAFSSHRSLARAEAAARGLLERGLHPHDLVGIAFYSPTRGLVVPLAFTSDRSQVERVLDALAVVVRGDAEAAARQRRAEAAGLGARPATLAARDPLGLTAGDFRAVVGRIGSLAGIEISPAGEAMGWIEDGDGAMSETLAQMDAITTPFLTAARRSEIEALAQSLAELARLTREVEGRKTLVFFSDGFDDAGMMGDAHERATAGGGQVLGNARLLQELNRMLEELRRSGWVLHSVEAFGLAGAWDQAGVGSEGLFYLAHETGGTFFNHRNDLGAAMADLLAAESVTYLLAFQADEVAQDGAFHKVRVRLTGAPRGARLSHRAGYFAPRPPAGQSPAERRLRSAELVVAGEPRADLPAAILAVPFRFSDERAYVPVVVEVPAGALAEEAAPGGLALELYGYAFDGDGRVEDHFSQLVEVDAARAASLGGPLRFVGDLLLPAGEHELRLLLRGGASGRTTLAVVPLAVPAPGRIAKRLLPPFFIATGGGGLTVREAGTAAAESAYPFRLGERPFVPEPRPVLAPDRDARLLLAAYHLAPGELRLTGRVLRPGGEWVDGGALVALGRLEDEDGELARVLATFRPVGLAPGEYQLEVTLAEPSGAAVTARAPFTVAGNSP